MKKKILLLISTVLALICIFTLSACKSKDTEIPEEPKSLKYVLNEDGVSYSVVGWGNIGTTDIVVPDTHEGLPVTAIRSESAVSGFMYATSISLPDTVTEIGDFAFQGARNLKTVTIPEKIITIGQNAFGGCESLTLTQITLPETLESIGSGAFSGCVSLTDVVIPNSVTYIGGNIFQYCNIKSITLPFLGSSVGNGIVNGKLDYTFSMIGDAKNTLQSVTLTNARYIAEEGFKNYTALTDVSISEGLISIDKNAFESCSQLKNIRIPSTIERIGEGAFANCTALSYHLIDNINYLGNEENYTVVAMSAESNDYISYPLSNRTRVIYEGAFKDCTQLKNIRIPNDITYIGISAFEGCSSLEYNIYDNAKYLGNEENKHIVLFSASDITVEDCEIHEETKIIYHKAFDLSKITSISIPDSVKSIGVNAFSSCFKLENVSIGNGVTDIEEEAFIQNPTLKNISLGSNVKRIWGHCMIDIISDEFETLFIPKSVECLKLSDGGTGRLDPLKEIIFENTVGWTLLGENVDVTDKNANAANIKESDTYGRGPLVRS